MKHCPSVIIIHSDIANFVSLGVLRQSNVPQFRNDLNFRERSSNIWITNYEMYLPVERYLVTVAALHVLV